MLMKQDPERRFSRASGQREGRVGMSGPPRSRPISGPRGRPGGRGELAGLRMWHQYQTHSGTSRLPPGMSWTPARPLAWEKSVAQAQPRGQG